MSEHELLARLPAVLGPSSAGLRLGIGDDAAWLDGDLVWTIDTLIEGVHALSGVSTLEDLGFRATMTSASDLAAMGAAPLFALAAVTLRDEGDFAGVRRGQEQALARLGAPIVGGNLTRGGERSISTTWLGRAPRPLLRSGARAGDGVFVAGALGLAAAGLEGLRRGIRVPEVCVAAHLRPVALIAAGLRAVEAGATSGIDVSDGLVADARHVACASSVALSLDAGALAAAGGAALEEAARALSRDALDLALSGGDDYALLFTGPQALARHFARVGVVEAGPPGVTVLRDGRPVELPGGFDHLG
ncbi:MAG: thiamine-phosphate kinase [Polyangiaceae bacterium]|nr:thiamine-phosphate kinase [Polyangiaceae bacterium]